jgi:hypothetical protein
MPSFTIYVQKERKDGQQENKELTVYASHLSLCTTTPTPGQGENQGSSRGTTKPRTSFNTLLWNCSRAPVHHFELPPPSNFAMCKYLRPTEFACGCTKAICVNRPAHYSTCTILWCERKIYLRPTEKSNAYCFNMDKCSSGKKRPAQS